MSLCTDDKYLCADADWLNHVPLYPRVSTTVLQYCLTIILETRLFKLQCESNNFHFKTLIEPNEGIAHVIDLCSELSVENFYLLCEMGSS